MTYDMNDVQPQIATDIIPDGTFAKITMIFKPGTIDGASPADAKLLKPSNSPGSDVQQIDAEFTIAEGLYARRKFCSSLPSSAARPTSRAFPSAGRSPSRPSAP